MKKIITALFFLSALSITAIASTESSLNDQKESLELITENSMKCIQTAHTQAELNICKAAIVQLGKEVERTLKPSKIN